MVLLVTQNNDFSSSWVQQWIHYLGGRCYVIVSSDTIEIVEYYTNKGNFDFSFIHNGKTFRLSQFKSIWFRRGWFTVMYGNMNSLQEVFVKSEIQSIEQHIQEELKTFQEHLYRSLARKSHVFGNVNQYNVNKLDVLMHAFESGLTIPEYCITTSKKILFAFQKRHHNVNILSKALRENIDYQTESTTVFHVNKVFTENDIALLPEHFQATLFQIYCEKYFEIRVFVIGEQMYAMAIFSQQNEKTKTDYRNYDAQKATRCLPYVLPESLESKIMNLMNSLNLKTASIDFMYSKEDEYVFLEVNPVGQFGIVSRSGNYQIEKHIAKILCA